MTMPGPSRSAGSLGVYYTLCLREFRAREEPTPLLSPCHQIRRTVRLHCPWILLGLCWLVCLLGQPVRATEIEITASKVVDVGKLRNGARLHGNRSYAYRGLPKAVEGLQYTLHEHKATSTLKVTVRKGGALRLFLFEGLTPGETAPGPRWEKSGTASRAAGNERITIYTASVKSGDTLTVKAADKWGGILAAETIVLHRSPARGGAPKPDSEYAELQKQIAASKDWNRPRLAREVLRQEALILPSDKTPVDIVLRRTRALLNRLRRMPDGPALEAEEAALKAIEGDNSPEMSDEAREALFDKLIALRRRIAFQNPLLTFDRILFLKHNGAPRFSHMVDQYLGFNQPKGGGLFVLEKPFSDTPTVRSLLADLPVTNGRLEGKTLEDNGSFISLELDWDAKTVYFAFTEAVATTVKAEDRVSNGLLEQMKNASRNRYYWAEDRVFHIFKADLALDGTASNLRQITFGKFNDFDPCVLPNGRIAFISGRIGGNQRCGSRMCSTYTLHGMMPDGSDIIPFSYHDTNEWHPSVDNDGRIVYTRWDYVDRDSDIAHHIWHCFPDGRDPRSYHGNYPKVRESRPWMELSIRAIPNSRNYIAVAAPHHGEAYGSLVMIDIRKPDDRSTSQVKRITPEIRFPESEARPGVPHRKGRANRRAQMFGTPWPLSEDFYLAVYDPRGKQGNRHAIVLVDSFGNRELLYRDPAIACLDPMPLRSRRRPPVIPVVTLQAEADRSGGEDLSTGLVAVMNVYDGEYAWPKGTKIKELRVVHVFPKPNLHMDRPRIGMADQSLARGVLGTVPVEEDGSVYFEAPTGASMYFQALDEKGMMVQNMRSATYLHPGETLTCMGCHELKQSAPESRGVPLALRRPPSTIRPEAPGSYPLTFPRLVQPVLDAKCVACHQKEERAASLRGDRFVTNKRTKDWSEAFATLSRHAWGKHGGNGALNRKNKRCYSLPGQEGARVSSLYKKLAAGHHDVKLSAEEMRRITLWLDCNSNYFGAYYDTGKQAKGKIVKPLLGLPRHTPFDTLKR
jgi:hypothetical protein